ncbi:MAG: polysaccharide biosynthesis C-terminal domain-containing protein [Acidimicrobiales bacterium]
MSAPTNEVRSAGAAAWPAEGDGLAGELRILWRGSSVGIFGQAANAALAFCFSLVVSRLFHARGTGTLFEAMAIFAIASNIGDLGADDGLNWKVPRLRAERRSADIRRLLPIACLPVLVVSSAIAAAVFLGAVPIAHLFTHGETSTHLSSFLRILAPFVPVAALVEVLIAGTRGFDRVWPLAAVWSVVIPVFRLLLLPVTLGLGLGLVGVAYSWAIPIILGAMALAWTLWSFVEHEREPVTTDVPATERSVLAREFWFFSAPRAVASICSMALVWVDVLLVGYIVSLRMAGIYGVANRYMLVVTFALAAVGGTIGPQISRLLSRGRMADVQTLYQTATGWVMAVAWPMALTLAVFSPVFMRLFGVEFAAGDTALTILALMMLYVSATGNNVVVLVMTGLTTTSLWVGIFTITLNVGANLLLIPRFGIDGAAVAWAISLLASNVLINAILYRRFGLHPVGPAFVPVALTATGCIAVPAVLARLVLGAHWSAVLLTAATGGVAYVVLLWRMRDRLALAEFLARFTR